MRVLKSPALLIIHRFIRPLITGCNPAAVCLLLFIRIHDDGAFKSTDEKHVRILLKSNHLYINGKEKKNSYYTQLLTYYQTDVTDDNSGRDPVTCHDPKISHWWLSMPFGKHRYRSKFFCCISDYISALKKCRKHHH